MRRITVLDGTAYHGTDDSVLIHMTGFNRVGLHSASVSDDGNRIRDFRNFVQLVGNHDAGDILAFQTAHQFQKVRGVCFVQCGGRLVQNQQLNILGKGFSDFYQLLLANTQVLDRGVRIQIQTNTLQQFYRLLTFHIPVNESVPDDLIAHKDILGNRQFRNHGQFLMDDDDAGIFRFLDVLKFRFLAVVNNLSFIRTIGINTGQNFHQGRFTSAVFAANRMDFTTAYFQCDTIQCTHTRKNLDDFPHLENDRIFHMQPPLILLTLSLNFRPGPVPSDAGRSAQCRYLLHHWKPLQNLPLPSPISGRCP